MLLHLSVKTISCVLCVFLATILFALFLMSDGSGGGQSATVSAAVVGARANSHRSSVGPATETETATPEDTETSTPEGTETATPEPQGCTWGAFHYLKPHPGSPANGGVVTLGQQIWFDLMVHTDGYYVTAQQAYITFTASVLQNVSPFVTNCALYTGVRQDDTIFELELQNEVCNGPGFCDFRGIINQPGDFAFASGAWSNPAYGGPDFRVAEMAFCVSRPGLATIHWQFTPPDPATRETMIVAAGYDEPVSNADCYKDYIIDAVNPVVTPGFTEVTLPTRTRTPTSTVTPTPTITPTPTDTLTPTSTLTPCVLNLSDVDPSDYFYEAAQYMYCQHIISGYSDRTFRPYQETTRAQLCKIVALSLGWRVNDDYEPHFTDVPRDDPFFGYIMASYSHNVISGYSDGTFQPGESVTRAQLSKIVVRSMKWRLNTTGGPHFSDVLPTDALYPYIETAYNHGVISGYADGTFQPSDPATRGQISKIVYNAIR